MIAHFISNMEVGSQQALELEVQKKNDSNESEGQQALEAEQEKNYDSNGEHILLEGKCWRKGLRIRVLKFYFGLGTAVSGVAVLFTVPLGCLCAMRGVKKWSIYLTDKSIVFNPMLSYPEFSFFFGCQKTFRISITDIEEIQAQSRVIRVGCCKCGTKLSFSKTILIEVKSGTEYGKYCCGLVKVPVVYEVNFCDNANEFVKAVKKQMNTIVRD